MGAPGSRGQPLLAKVPEVTLYFWLAKVLTTCMGEATSDMLVFGINRYVAVVLGFVAFAVALALQLRTRRYRAWAYWFLVAMVAVFGTMVADVTHIVLGVPYYLSTSAFALILAAVFVTWRRVEGTLSIHSIRTRRRELFYWAAVLATFALGTAAGDMSATSFHLGYLASGIIYALLFLVPFVGRRLFAWSEVFAFWASYVLTRPFGASFADWFDMPRRVGGLHIPRPIVAGVLALFLMGVVGYLARSRIDIQPEPEEECDAAAGATCARPPVRATSTGRRGSPQRDP